MKKWFLGRFWEMLITLLIVVTVTFVTLRLLPGGPFDSEVSLDPQVQKHLEESYGLHQPLLVQYFDYLKMIAQGDWGYSLTYLGRSVSEMISSTFPTSLGLGVMALFVTLAGAFSLGLLAARYSGRWADEVFLALSTAGMSLPSFLVAPVLIIIFSFWLDWFPPALWESPLHYVLPVVTLSIRPMSLVARLVRTHAIDVMAADYIQTARAKGAPEWLIMVKHVLRNSLIPTLGIMGPIVAQLLSGSFIVESMFAIPGMAKYLIEGVTNRDYTLVVALSTLYGFILILSQFVMDVVAHVVDPRIEASR
ncbi:MAG: ABC transporter permease [Oligoflexia bacterium]|nr:ABC transporter permease [Oligoflexia bacterium]